MPVNVISPFKFDKICFHNDPVGQKFIEYRSVESEYKYFSFIFIFVDCHKRNTRFKFLPFFNFVLSVQSICSMFANALFNTFEINDWR